MDLREIGVCEFEVVPQLTAAMRDQFRLVDEQKKNLAGEQLRCCHLMVAQSRDRDPVDKCDQRRSAQVGDVFCSEVQRARIAAFARIYVLSTA